MIVLIVLPVLLSIVKLRVVYFQEFTIRMTDNTIRVTKQSKLFTLLLLHEIERESHCERTSKMAPRTDSQTLTTGSATSDTSGESSIDPIFHILRLIPFSFLRPPRLRLKIPSFTLPSPMTVFALILLTYFLVISGFVYDVIVEPPGIGSTQDPNTGAIRPVVFMSGRVNGQYIIEGLSSGFMFVMGGVGIIMLDLALDKNRAKSVKASYATAGVTSIVIGYVMSMLFIRIKIPGYLH